MNEFMEKLIGRLEETRWTTIFDTSCIFENDKLDKCIEIVNQLAEEYNNGWIPCSERLPERLKPFQTSEYAVTMRYKGKGIPVVSSASFDYNAEKWLIKDYDVIAWQPLPEPWKGGTP